MSPAKTCSKCKKELPEERFSIRGNEGFRRTDCKDCVNKRTRQAERLKAKYGKAPKDYICPICHRGQDEFSRAFSLDHDHGTGEFRGWLCHNCNTGLGLFRDSIEGLQRAMVYLKRTTIEKRNQSLISRIWQWVTK